MGKHGQEKNDVKWLRSLGEWHGSQRMIKVQDVRKQQIKCLSFHLINDLNCPCARTGVGGRLGKCISPGLAADSAMGGCKDATQAKFYNSAGFIRESHLNAHTF